ncbi:MULTISPECIES: universal stress protein [Natrialbaceae]|uniref:universal stress protein n=1 Tax=Natrialbaceae TaxID=1644061 RepID=UPI00207D6CF5|nr:universal stress protein [Natronococcus sp. CG52]
MERALVVIEPSQKGRELTRIAGEFAEGLGGELIIIHALDESKYQEEIQRKGHSGAEIKSESDLIEEASNTAEEIATDALKNYDVSYTAEGMVGSLPNDLLDLATEQNCDHVFITGEQRSPTGKAVFGDISQKILLNFDGPVTTLIAYDE